MRLQSISGKALLFAASTVFLGAAPVDIPSDPPQMTLVFSGVQLPDITYDAFCVRSVKFTLRKNPNGPLLRDVR